jgi:formylglycine-generating enzyme required for sulfatase activity
MILIPAGTFSMGSNDDHVQQATDWCKCGSHYFEDELYMHDVYVSAFYIDRYEVTNRQFQAFVEATGYRTDAEKKPEVNTWRTAFTPGKEEHPVIWMSWNDANAYCQWAGARLPTEAEWEKAARGDDARLWPWGSEWDNTRLNAAESQTKATTEIGSFPNGASPYGAMDMAGNVWEWVNDWYDPTFYQYGANRTNDPTGPQDGQDRVLRGGGYNNGLHDVRTANRHKGGMTGYAPDHGFRCAKSAN